MIVDSHCHYNLEPLFEKWQTYWKESQEAGVHASIIVGVDPERNERACQIAQNDTNLFCAIGLHPEDAPTESFEKTKSVFEKQIQTYKTKIVAIGECGLDYYSLAERQGEQETEKQRQKTLFFNQILFAQEHDLPVIIHARDAYQDILEVLEKAQNISHKQVRGVLHCVSGPIDYVKKAIDMGLYIGFAGNVTFKNAHALRELAQNTPLDRILVETDAPFLTPEPHRGERPNHPKNIVCTATFLAEHVFSLPLDVFAKQTAQNTARLFQRDAFLLPSTHTD